MSDDIVTVWGGVPRLGRSPVVGDLLIGNGPSTFRLGGGALDHTALTPPESSGNMEVTLVGGAYNYGFAGYHASLVSTVSQTNPVAGATNIIYYDGTPVSAYGVSVVTNGTTLSRITVEHSGVYNVQFSAQITTVTGGTPHPAFIWLRKDGSNVVESNTQFDLPKNAARFVAAWNWMIELTSGQYVEIVWASADTGMLIEHVASPAYGPGIPSIITTIQLVR